MTWWDCVWIDNQCLTCYYWHRMVQQKEQPKCPRNLDPNWRMLFADEEMKNIKKRKKDERKQA